MESQIRDAEATALARSRGYDLVQRETDTGNLVWTWRGPGNAPEPTFLRRSQAVAYMYGRLS